MSENTGRRVGVQVHGVRMPVIKKGDNLVKMVAQYLVEASGSSYAPFTLRDRDVVGVTESLLARAQGNFVTLDEIAADVRAKFPSGDVAVAFPILSRNRFVSLLKGIVQGISGKINVFLSCPADEVGNHLVDPLNFFKNSAGLPDLFDEKEFDRRFGRYIHPFTGVDYIELYKALDPNRVAVHFTNNPLRILDITKQVVMANIHGRKLYADLLREKGADVVTLDQICTAPQHEGGGYNPDFGLLGSNYSREDAVKLFPRDAESFAVALQKEIFALSGKKVETMVYGDGAFKDPVGGIWELADPVVSPGFTEGLKGTPSEVKFKMIADNAQGDAEKAVRDAIQSKPAASTKESGLSEEKNALGTTPRRFTDLLGSLCDLVSGSGDRGTPVIHISGYFDSYIDN